ncbi:RAD51-associated protein 1 isoform X2 [Eleutherodactylus coqui]|uniref:RAD51-associated protein 1 isoform X2 n=1 Tax=Eleutherodactylus coqui TaxID=57060 RepID=UPI003462192A
MDRPARNKKSVDYSQFLDLEDDDGDFASSPPISKKARLEPKKEKKEKVVKKGHKEEAALPDPQRRRLPLDDKLYQRDLEVALALSVEETSAVIENDEKIPRNEASEDASRCIKDPDVTDVSFSNCSVNSSSLGLEEITDDNEDLIKGRGRRQAASKAITKQRKLLIDESGDEEEADEFHPDTIADGDSESDASFSGEDEEFEVKKSKKPSSSKVAKQKSKSVKKEKNGPEPQKAATRPPTQEIIKIKSMPAKKAPVTAPATSQPASHVQPPVGMKRPSWTPPGKLEDNQYTTATGVVTPLS